jgi:hypothetical protein
MTNGLAFLSPQTLVIYALGVVLQDPNVWPSPYEYETSVVAFCDADFHVLAYLYSFSKFCGENSICGDYIAKGRHCIPFLCSPLLFVFYESSICHSWALLLPLLSYDLLNYLTYTTVL